MIGSFGIVATVFDVQNYFFFSIGKMFYEGYNQVFAEAMASMQRMPSSAELTMPPA